MENKLLCKKCQKIAPVRAEGMYALIKVEKAEDSFTFFPNTGVLTIVYVCPECGDIDLRSAKVAGEI